MKFVFVHSTDFPQTQGRTAWKFYMPTAACLASMGHTVAVVAPRHDEEIRWHPLVHPGHFHFLGEMAYWLPGRCDVLVLWTDKAEERKLAEAVSKQGIKVLFAELAWFPHYRSWYVDEEGCGPDSSLVDFVPEVTGPMLRKGGNPKGPVGLLLQMEHDNAWRSSPFANNADFVGFMQQRWPDETFLVRRHPRDPAPSFLPPMPRVSIDTSETLGGFLEKCKAAVGLNTSALYAALEEGLPCYMLANGPGRFSGAFLPDPKMAPALAAEINPEWHQRRQRAAGLLAELRRRQISMDLEMNPSVLQRHPVFGPLLSNDEGTNGTVLREPGGVRSVVPCG